MLSNQWLQNKSFIQWRLFPSEEDNLYWEKFIQDNPHFQNEIEEAIRILKSIKLNTQKLSPEEKQEIFALIQKNIEKKDKQRHFRIYLTVSAVACIVLFLVLLQPLFTGKNKISHKNMLVVADTTSVNQKDIQLVLANNRTITFEEDADIKYETVKPHPGQRLQSMGQFRVHTQISFYIQNRQKGDLGRWRDLYRG